MSKPIECKKCGKLNKTTAAACWYCGNEVQPKQTPKEAIQSEIKYRHEVLHKKRVRRFWIFTSIVVMVMFGFVFINSIYGVMREITPNDYDSYVTIRTEGDQTYIEVEFTGIDMNSTRLRIDSILLSNEDSSLEISASKSNPWEANYAFGIFRARLIISTPVSELEIYDAVQVKFSFIVFSTILPVPTERLYYEP